jgi:hypothetical protein
MKGKDMSNTRDQGLSCTATCWVLAALMAVLLVVLLLVYGAYPFLPAAVMGALSFAIGGFVFKWAFCDDVKEDDETQPE